MAWTIEYADSVHKALRKLDPNNRRRIRDLLEGRVATADDPRTLGKPLTSELSNYRSYRAGDYHAICEIKDRAVVILVLRIGHRREVYRR